MISKISFGESIPFFIKHDKESNQSKILANRSFTFAKDRINVIVGENGSGKSSLLTLLAHKLLAYNYGHTRLDGSIIRRNDECWTNDGNYWRKEEYMQGITLEADSPVYGTYISSTWTPCDALDWAHALCYGLGEEATDHFKRVQDFSSGQGMSNVIANMALSLKNRSPEVDCSDVTWQLQEDYDGRMGDRAKKLFAQLPQAGSNIVALFDEPERTLDLGSQVAFWKMLEQISMYGHVQVIVVTHSVVPLFNPEKFNFISMSENYVDKIFAGLKEMGNL